MIQVTCFQSGIITNGLKNEQIEILSRKNIAQDTKKRGKKQEEICNQLFTGIMFSQKLNTDFSSDLIRSSASML